MASCRAGAESPRQRPRCPAPHPDTPTGAELCPADAGGRATPSPLPLTAGCSRGPRHNAEPPGSPRARSLPQGESLGGLPGWSHRRSLPPPRAPHSPASRCSSRGGTSRRSAPGTRTLAASQGTAGQHPGVPEDVPAASRPEQGEHTGTAPCQPGFRASRGREPGTLPPGTTPERPTPSRCSQLPGTGSPRARCPYLSRHVHEQDGGDGRLRLAVALLGAVQRVRLQHPKQVLLPVETPRGARAGERARTRPGGPPGRAHRGGGAR